jgi:hypothetical protein
MLRLLRMGRSDSQEEANAAGEEFTRILREYCDREGYEMREVADPRTVAAAAIAKARMH